MLADDTLEDCGVEEVRTYAKNKIDFVAEFVLAEFRSRVEATGSSSLWSRSPGVGSLTYPMCYTFDYGAARTNRKNQRTSSGARR